MSKQQFLAESLKQGEIYAGLILGKDRQLDHHLVLLEAKPTKMNWSAALAWAASVGGDLPTRREQSLLIANFKEEFEAYYYWSNAQYAYDPDYAWLQNFGFGNQLNGRKSDEYRARAVRRIPIKE